MLKNHTAILVIDTIHDFATGCLPCPSATEIVPALNQLLATARACENPVIFCHDAHIRGLDKELMVWGDHAITGSWGAKLIPEITLSPTDYILTKRRYSAFFQTGLELLLRELDIQIVLLAGFHVPFGIYHTAVDAFSWGYEVIVAEDATASRSKEEQQKGLDAIHIFCHGKSCFVSQLNRL